LAPWATEGERLSHCHQKKIISVIVCLRERQCGPPDLQCGRAIAQSFFRGIVPVIAYRSSIGSKSWYHQDAAWRVHVTRGHLVSLLPVVCIVKPRDLLLHVVKKHGLHLERRAWGSAWQHGEHLVDICYICHHIGISAYVCIH
jgi:hypothetical protein